MSNAAPDILAAALSLSDSERANIAYELLQSLKPPGILSDDDPEFAAELQRRLDSHEKDPSAASDVEDVTRRIRAALHAHRAS